MRRFGIRAKLLMVTAVLALIPLVGFGLIREMESFLRAGQEQAVIATARAGATALHDRPQLLELRSVPPPAAARGARAGSTTETAIEPAEAQPSGSLRALPREERIANAAAIGEIELIVKGLGRAQSRIWIIDQRRQLLVLTGSLRRGAESAEQLDWWQSLLRPLVSLLLAPPSEDFDDALPESVVSGGKEVDSALTGIPASRRRASSDGRAAIVAAAHPIWSGEEVIGAVVVEETTNAVASLRYRAFERLLGATLVVFLLGVGSLFVFASRLSGRRRRLRDAAESAIDAQGRVKRLVPASGATDEIGDLSRSFTTMLERLAQYNAYLERMADRLSHELRTPVAVVSSSLDNLKTQTLPAEALTYITRAEDGIKRLHAILTRMREATRLERMLHEVEREPFDLAKIVAGCVAGYGGAFPEHRFNLRLPAHPVPREGSAELVAQMLDKIIENATDFSPKGAPIDVSLAPREDAVVLAVANEGPRLPEAMQGQLFESMISVRGAGGDGAPHLGLGLFMVRLIAEVHGARASARTRDDGRGVVVEIAFPTTRAPD